VIDLEQRAPDGAGATFIHSSAPGVTATSGPGATCEARCVLRPACMRECRADRAARIDELFLDKSAPACAYRLETYRSAGAVSASSAQQLRCYFVTRCRFPPGAEHIVPANPTPSLTDGAPPPVDIRAVSDAAFLERATENTLAIYGRVLNHVLARYGPVIEVFEVEESRERRLVIGYKSGACKGFFSALSHLYHFYGLYAPRKYVEQFACGVTIISLYLNPLPDRCVLACVRRETR
jgi:glutamate dehydrogenase